MSGTPIGVRAALAHVGGTEISLIGAFSLRQQSSQCWMRSLAVGPSIITSDVMSLVSDGVLPSGIPTAGGSLVAAVSKQCVDMQCCYPLAGVNEWVQPLTTLRCSSSTHQQTVYRVMRSASDGIMADDERIVAHLSSLCSARVESDSPCDCRQVVGVGMSKRDSAARTVQILTHPHD